MSTWIIIYLTHDDTIQNPPNSPIQRHPFKDNDKFEQNGTNITIIRVTINILLSKWRTNHALI